MREIFVPIYECIIFGKMINDEYRRSRYVHIVASVDWKLCPLSNLSKRIKGKEKILRRRVNIKSRFLGSSILLPSWEKLFKKFSFSEKTY